MFSMYFIPQDPRLQLTIVKSCDPFQIVKFETVFVSQYLTESLFIIYFLSRQVQLHFRKNIYLFFKLGTHIIFKIIMQNIYMRIIYIEKHKNIKLRIWGLCLFILFFFRFYIFIYINGYARYIFFNINIYAYINIRKRRNLTEYTVKHFIINNSFFFLLIITSSYNY